jgi:carboxyl-terminal processing protease
VPGDELTRRLELMLRSLRIARDWHVSKPAKPVLIDGAIRGMLARLDPEAELYSRADLRRFTGSSEADGLGLELRREPASRRQPSLGYRVVSSRDGSAAALAGLKAGDLITRIDGRPAGELPHLAVMHTELAGKAGTSLELTVERGGTEAEVQIHLVRGLGLGPAVEVAEPVAGVLVVRLAAVEAAATDRLERDVSAAAARLGPAFRGLVLDLRGTAGGSSAEAPALADAFLERGPLPTEETRNGSEHAPAMARPGDIAASRPVIVLIDAGTAGPAEAVAGALQEARRARVVGVRSAGRGAIRTLLMLGRRGEKGAVRVTTRRLRTPAGRAIEGTGITPDQIVAQAPADAGCRGSDITDRRLIGHCMRRGLAEDAQLQRALAMLAETVASGAALPQTRP